MATEERDEATHVLKLMSLGAATFTLLIIGILCYSAAVYKEQKNKCISELANTSRSAAEIKDICQ